MRFRASKGLSLTVRASVASHATYIWGCLFPISFFDSPGRLCVLIVAYLGYLHLYFDIRENLKVDLTRISFINFAKQFLRFVATFHIIVLISMASA